MIPAESFPRLPVSKWELISCKQGFAIGKSENRIGTNHVATYTLSSVQRPITWRRACFYPYRDQSRGDVHAFIRTGTNHMATCTMRTLQGPITWRRARFHPYRDQSHSDVHDANAKLPVVLELLGTRRVVLDVRHQQLAPALQNPRLRHAHASCGPSAQHQ